MNDAWLIIGIFIFAFVLWVSTGGPNRPISFAGPYLTPLNQVGDVEVGDAENSWGLEAGGGGDGGTSGGTSFWSTNTIFGWGNDDESIENPSPYRGQVEIASGSSGPSATDEDQEYVTVRATGRASSIPVTGWRLVSDMTGASVTIPRAELIARRSGSVAEIVLGPSQEIVITTGRSPSGSSFRENACTGYLAENRTFTPALRTSCPNPTDELGRFFEGNAAAYNECREDVANIRRCTDASAPRGASSRCRAFVDDYLNYSGCVRIHETDPDFLGSSWRVYLGRGTELWRTDNEIIRLLDREGRTVDVYRY